MESGAVFYIKQGNAYVIKLNGDVRYTMGCALGDFLTRLKVFISAQNVVRVVGQRCLTL